MADYIERAAEPLLQVVREAEMLRRAFDERTKFEAAARLFKVLPAALEAMTESKWQLATE